MCQVSGFFITIISIFCIKRIVHLNFLRSGGHLGERPLTLVCLPTFFLFYLFFFFNLI